MGSCSLAFSFKGAILFFKLREEIKANHLKEWDAKPPA